MTNQRPWGEEYWNEHRVMIAGELKGKPVLLVNIYASSLGVARVKFFQQLNAIPFPDDMELLTLMQDCAALLVAKSTTRSQAMGGRMPRVWQPQGSTTRGGPSTTEHEGR